ncbi:MAG: hypothetical protein SF123_07690 [Chloroflexota bacterium]|nr:hypothetical protein [Chloroflexota bacterium]
MQTELLVYASERLDPGDYFITSDFSFFKFVRTVSGYRFDDFVSHAQLTH